MSSPSAATALRGDADSILNGGDLREHGPLDVLTAAHQSQITGSLYFKGAEGERITVFAMEGDLIAAQCVEEAQRLGNRLVGTGQLHAEQVARVLKTATNVTELGDAIRSHKWLSSDAVEKALSDQFLDNLNHTFLLNQGSYKVERLDAVFADNLQLFFDTEDLLSEGKLITDRLLPLHQVLKVGEYGLTPGSGASSQSLKGAQQTLFEATKKNLNFADLLQGHSAGLVTLLKDLGTLLEQKVLALRPLDSAKPPTVEERSKRDKKAGVFMSQDTVLDKVDLSHVTHFAVATDIPLSGVIETVGAEDMEEHERKLKRTATVPPRQPVPPTAPKRRDTPPQALSPAPAKTIKSSSTPPADFEDSDEFIITEDGEELEEFEGAKTILSGVTPNDPLVSTTKLYPLAPALENGHIVLTAPQRQSLRRRAQVYNKMFRLLFGHACEHSRKGDAIRSFQSFFTGGAGTYPELFKGIQFRSDGTLNAHSLIENLETQAYKRPFEVFDLALHEALSHLLSGSTQLSPNAESEAQIQEAIGQIRRQLFRPGAPMPTLR